MKAYHLTAACVFTTWAASAPVLATSPDKTHLADLSNPRVWDHRTPWVPSTPLLRHIASDELGYKTQPMRTHQRDDAQRGIPSPAPTIRGPQFWTLSTGDHVAQFDVGPSTWFLVRYTTSSPAIIEESGFFDARNGHRLSDRYERWDDLETRSRKWWSSFADDFASLTRPPPRSP